MFGKLGGIPPGPGGPGGIPGPPAGKGNGMPGPPGATHTVSFGSRAVQVA